MSSYLLETLRALHEEVEVLESAACDALGDFVDALAAALAPRAAPEPVTWSC